MKYGSISTDFDSLGYRTSSGGQVTVRKKEAKKKKEPGRVPSVCSYDEKIAYLAGNFDEKQFVDLQRAVGEHDPVRVVPLGVLPRRDHPVVREHHVHAATTRVKLPRERRLLETRVVRVGVLAQPHRSALAVQLNDQVDGARHVLGSHSEALAVEEHFQLRLAKDRTRTMMHE